MTQDSDHGPGRYATSSEVRDAVQALSNEDWYRLRKRAQLEAHETRQRPEDLVAEAISASWIAACTLEESGKPSGRPWPRHVPFVAYLTMTIRGIASDARRSAENRRMVQGSVLPELGAPSEEDELIDTESGVLANEVLALLKQDKAFLVIIDGYAEGLTPRQICERAQMTAKEYESARRRLRRSLERLKMEANSGSSG